MPPSRPATARQWAAIPRTWTWALGRVAPLIAQSAASSSWPRRTWASARVASITALRAAGVGSGFRFVLDFGRFHGLNDAQRLAMGREVTAVTVPDATMLMIAWAPGRRGPLPRGASRGDIEAAFAGWQTIGEDALPASALPGPLRHADPRLYRLRRD